DYYCCSKRSGTTFVF
nr:immunoglobulin light chain junction region [Macaca mulatta]MOX80624.1 immunoglobulin light chain junction region [Macaca mulatta]